MKSAICLTVKNERRDIAEWIAHYTGLGADQIIIYDDGSDDGTTELLERLSSIFPVRHIRWTTSQSLRQNAAYTDCMQRFGNEFDWIGFLDGDEFLIPPAGQLLPDLLNRHQDHDAIAINWLVFGTAGVADTNGSLITETFTRRAEDNFDVNRHVKIFVRPSKFKKVSHPHYFEGFTNWTDVMGMPVVWSDTLGITKDVIVGDWRLHHYVLRSDAHWERRLKRGRDHNKSPNRGQDFFDDHDRNEVTDTTALAFAQLTKERLGRAGLFDVKSPPQPVFRRPKIELQGERAQKAFGRSPVFGCVDGFHKNNIRGWVLLRSDGEKVGGLTVEITCNGVVIGHTVANASRADVAHVHNADAMCGFVFEIPGPYRKTSVQDFAVRVTNYDFELSPRVSHAFPDHGSSLEMSNFTLKDYPIWAAIRQQSLRAAHGRPAPDAPLVSIVCPIQQPHTGDFIEAVESVLKQTHPNWELILVTDHTEGPDLLAQIEAYHTRDPRIVLIQSEQTDDKTTAMNAGLTAARGQYVSFLNADDVLDPVALEVMAERAKKTGALLLYSDEDQTCSDGTFSNPAFKPDWNYRYLLGINYVGHFSMVDRNTLIESGGVPVGYNGAQDYAMMLRLSEVIPDNHIVHVPEVLYHWRSLSDAVAGDARKIEAGQRAVQDHLVRRGIHGAEVTNIDDKPWYNIQWAFDNEPKVCVIIPFKDKADITGECLRRVLETKYGNFEVILVDNNSEEEETRKFCADAVKDSRVRVMRIEESFNYSLLNNRAAKETKASYLVLMNNDLHVCDPLWLRTMVNEATADNSAGVVGGKFYYPGDAGIQHAGVVTGIGGCACHIHGELQPDDPGFGARAVLAQELTVVTGACLLVNRQLFVKIGGLDEEHLTVALNDVDLCLEARRNGAKVIWTPSVVAIHHESLSRGSDNSPVKAARFAREMAYMQTKWGATLARDPYYHPAFRLDVDDAFNHLCDPRSRERAALPSPIPAGRWTHG